MHSVYNLRTRFCSLGQEASTASTNSLQQSLAMRKPYDSRFNIPKVYTNDEFADPLPPRRRGCLNFAWDVGVTSPPAPTDTPHSVFAPKPFSGQPHIPDDAKPVPTALLLFPSFPRPSPPPLSQRAHPFLDFSSTWVLHTGCHTLALAKFPAVASRPFFFLFFSQCRVLLPLPGIGRT